MPRNANGRIPYFHSIHLGLTDTVVQMVFRTGEGFTASWANWAANEPNNPPHGNQQDCVRRRATGLWTDMPCTETLKYYCEGISCKLKSGKNVISSYFVVLYP